MSTPDQIIQDGWAPVPPDQVDTPPQHVQAELVGKPFRRNVAREEDTTPAMQERVVRIAAILNGQTGQTEFRPLDALPEKVHPSDVPHVPLAKSGVIFDRAEEGAPMLPTAQKRKASKPFVNLDAQTRARGGDPDFRKPKHEQGGWISPAERARVKALAESQEV